jgi:hypothetical protein
VILPVSRSSAAPKDAKIVPQCANFLTIGKKEGEISQKWEDKAPARSVFSAAIRSAPGLERLINILLCIDDVALCWNIANGGRLLSLVHYLQSIQMP